MATIKAIEGRSVHQIQSGQVIVDLNSVVKELVENSLDAGATSVDIRFRNQGLDSIEVQDNGKGISPDDYETVALKHHTSKLSAYEDLTSLDTFGFRGEALSSLCALSKFHILTARAEDGAVGKRLDFELSGRLKAASVAAAQKGTTVSVDDIFFNLPVRRKELEKNIKREYGKVVSLLYQYACISVGVRFSVSNQMPKGKKVAVFSTKSNTTTKENIVNVFGAKTLLALIKLDLTLDMAPSTGPSTQGARNWSTQATDRSLQVKVEGHISKPVFGEGRQAPDRQMFFVNSRPCQLPQVSKAINEVYKSFNVTQSPFIFANLVMDTISYDVNVSPDKRTIMLHDQTALLESLKTALTELFEQTDHTVPQSTLPNRKLPSYQPLNVPKQASRENTMETEDDDEDQDRPQKLEKLALPKRKLPEYQPLTVPRLDPADSNVSAPENANHDEAEPSVSDEDLSRPAAGPVKRMLDGDANGTPPSVLQGWLGRDIEGRSETPKLRKPSTDLSKDKQRLANAMKGKAEDASFAGGAESPNREETLQIVDQESEQMQVDTRSGEDAQEPETITKSYKGWDRAAMRKSAVEEPKANAENIMVDGDVAERLRKAHGRAEAKANANNAAVLKPDLEPDPMSTPYDDLFSQRPSHLDRLKSQPPVAPVATMQSPDKVADTSRSNGAIAANRFAQSTSHEQALEPPPNVVADRKSGMQNVAEPAIPATAPGSQKGTPGPVQNAFDRMRPKRTPLQTAEITVGDKTTTTVIGSSPLYKKRRVHAPEKSQAIAIFGASPLLARGLRNFAAPGSQMAVDSSDVPMSNGRAAAPVESEEDEEDGDESGSDDGESSLQRLAVKKKPPPPDEERTSDPLDEMIPAPADDDEYDEDYIDEREKRMQEDERVARLIQEAEEAAARLTDENLRRASQMLKNGGSRKESTLQLMRMLHTSATDIERRAKALQHNMQAYANRESKSGSENAVVKDEFGDTEAETKLSLTVSKADFERMICIGQFNLGFILAIRPASDDKDEDELFIIDQHAADEKYNYERLQRTVRLQSQRLVRPKALELTAFEEEVILNNPDALKANGFEVETTSYVTDDEAAGRRCRLLTLPISGEKTFELSDLEELLHLLSETPAGSSEIPRPKKVQRMLAMRACRSSIMVGKTLTMKQMGKVVRHMGEMEKPWNCPHGRPTMRHLAGLGAWSGWQEGDLVEFDEEAGSAQLGRKTDWKTWLEGRHE